jgi:CBS domain-containing protein
MAMTQVSDVMTRGVRSLTPEDTVVQAAQAMQQLDVGAIPVCSEDMLVGIVTDRDIVVRGVAQSGLDAHTGDRPQQPAGGHRVARRLGGEVRSGRGRCRTALDLGAGRTQPLWPLSGWRRRPCGGGLSRRGHAPPRLG